MSERPYVQNFWCESIRDILSASISHPLYKYSLPCGESTIPIKYHGFIWAISTFAVDTTITFFFNFSLINFTTIIVCIKN